MKNPTVSLIASAVAAMFTNAGCGYVASAEESPDTVVKCQGINDCKGQGQCGGVHPDGGGLHACEGQNDCKGQGWIEVANRDCTARGGTRLR